MNAPCAHASATARTILRRSSPAFRLSTIGERLASWLGGLGLTGRVLHSRNSAGSQARARTFTPKTRSLRFEVPALPEMTCVVRARVARFARALPFSDQEIADICLAVGEAVVNAVQHGENPRWPRVGIEMRARGSTLRVAVWDRGRGFDPRKLCLSAECLAERGRGIFVMRSLMDEVRFRFTRSGTRVEMTKVVSRAGKTDRRRTRLAQSSTSPQPSPKGEGG